MKNGETEKYLIVFYIFFLQFFTNFLSLKPRVAF